MNLVETKDSFDYRDIKETIPMSQSKYADDVSVGLKESVTQSLTQNVAQDDENNEPRFQSMKRVELAVSTNGDFRQTMPCIDENEVQNVKIRLNYLYYKVRNGWEHLPLEKVAELSGVDLKEESDAKARRTSSNKKESCMNLDALGFAAGLVASKQEINKEVSSQCSPPSASDDGQAAALLTSIKTPPAQQLGIEFIAYANHFRRKIYPNLSEYSSGLWDKYLEKKAEFETKSAEVYGQLGKPLISPDSAASSYNSISPAADMSKLRQKRHSFHVARPPPTIHQYSISGFTQNSASPKTKILEETRAKKRLSDVDASAVERVIRSSAKRRSLDPYSLPVHPRYCATPNKSFSPPFAKIPDNVLFTPPSTAPRNSLTSQSLLSATPSSSGSYDSINRSLSLSNSFKLPPINELIKRNQSLP